MGFFERQDVARRNSRLLLGFFFLATFAIIAVMDVVAMLVWYFGQLFTGHEIEHMPLWLHVAVMGGVAGMIVYISVRKTLELRAGGGPAVAQMVGARPVIPAKASPLEKRLLNIVAEMAIASGTRVPRTYVMDEHRGINAFAAGFDGGVCAIVVTRGALERLNRDEMQGVIGHEFSHIVNGDMSFNMSMVGVLAGLTFVGASGAHLMRVIAEAKYADAHVAPAMLVSGVALFIIGYVGLFAAQLVKAKVSSEREHLADAGSVQFTRNPEGLAGALDQVRSSHSWVLHPSSEDVSHLYFAEALYLDEERSLSTHPPIEERIRRLAPGFAAGAYRARRTDPMAELEKDFKEQEKRAVEGSEVASAAMLVAALPQALRTSLETIGGPSAAVLALMLSIDDRDLPKETAAIEAAGLGPLAGVALRQAAITRTLPRAAVLPLADLALAQLRDNASDKHRADLIRALEAIVDANPAMSVYRFAYFTFMKTQLAPERSQVVGNKSIADLRDEILLVLSLVVYAGCAGTSRDPAHGFAAAVKEMELPPASALIPPERCDTQTVMAAMRRLRELGPMPKARLVKGLLAAVTSEGTIRLTEAALMRMVGAVLDCPLPPMAAPEPVKV